MYELTFGEHLINKSRVEKSVGSDAPKRGCSVSNLLPFPVFIVFRTAFYTIN